MAKTLIVFASKQEFQFFFKNISSVVASSTPAMVNCRNSWSGNRRFLGEFGSVLKPKEIRSGFFAWRLWRLSE